MSTYIVETSVILESQKWSLRKEKEKSGQNWWERNWKRIIDNGFPVKNGKEQWRSVSE